MSKISKRNRILAAALGFVATTGACGAFGTFATFENRALFGEETSTAASGRQIVVEPKGGELAKPSARKAFLVAADDYGDAANSLPCTKNDVKALKTRLETLGFTTVVLETGDNRQTEPTKAIIERRFKRFVESLRPGDFALVYLSGHGLKPTDSDESFFAPVDVDVEDLFATSVSIDRMLADLKASDATFRWVIVDACRDDPTNPEDDEAAVFKGASKSIGARALGDVKKVPDSVALLQSCQPGKRSYEGGGRGAERIENGFFTLSLLEALDDENSQADANGDGALTFLETIDYVSKRTDELATRSYGVSQIPNLSGSITNFALLDELLIDGIKKSDWNKADALYREACVFRGQKKWREALAKIKKAREINKARKEYETAETEIQAWVDSLAVGEANALYQAAVNALLADDLATAKSKCEASLKAFETDAAQTLLKTINDKIAAASRPKPDPEPPRQVAQNGGSTSGTETTSTGRTSTPTGGSTSGRTSNASGAWSGEYAAGTSKSLTIKGETYTFHYCPTGSFTMGSPESEADRSSNETQHRVTLDGFWMLETEVTQAMWKSVMGLNPSKYTSSERNPVENVSWNDCQDFIAKLNSSGVAPSGFKFRLPTEAEWEYACRAGTTGPYAGSSLDALGWYCYNTGTTSTEEVKQKNANGWGLYDMHGNVWEWCEDKYAAYDTSNNVQNPINITEGSDRVLRGGGWGHGAGRCRSAIRYSSDPANRSNYNGFRLALVRSSSSR